MEIRKRVDNILKKLNISIAPIPLEQVAKFFSLEVVDYPGFPDSVSGALIKEEGLQVIGVNENHPLVRRRFTIAHELGHYIMGHDVTSVLDHAFDGATDKEREANQFASELLMPKNFLKKDLDQKQYTIKDLASRYLVSEQSMSIRLIETQLLNHSNLKPNK